MVLINNLNKIGNRKQDDYLKLKNNFISEFEKIYRGEKLKELLIQYVDYSFWENKMNKSSAIEKIEEYWINKFKDCEFSQLNLPYDYKIIESTLIDEGRITQRQLNNCISNLEIGESIEDICKDYPSCSSDLRLYLETYQNTNELRKSEEIPIK